MAKNRIISIHQPGYLPWLGFFHKILSVDTFVFLDHIEYARRNWHNRNKIRTSQGSQWLSVPIKKSVEKNLNDVIIEYNINWELTHLKTIKYNYQNAKSFDYLWKDIEKIYQKKFEKLIELNISLIKLIIDKLKIETNCVFSSNLDIKEKGSDMNLEICKKLDAEIYYSGEMGKNYLDIGSFKKNSIFVKFQEFKHPVYNQYYKPFIPNMGAIDLIFNKGEKSLEILQSCE